MTTTHTIFFYLGLALFGTKLIATILAVRFKKSGTAQPVWLQRIGRAALPGYLACLILDGTLVRSPMLVVYVALALAMGAYEVRRRRVPAE